MFRVAFMKDRFEFGSRKVQIKTYLIKRVHVFIKAHNARFTVTALFEDVEDIAASRS